MWWNRIEFKLPDSIMIELLIFNVRSSPTCRRLNLRVGVRVSQSLENNYINITAN